MPAIVDVQLGARFDLRRAAPGLGGRRALCALMKKAARAALRRTDTSDARISVTLLDDSGIEDLHRRWLGRAGPTDVLAFGLHEDGEPPVGDVYVGLEQAKRQAAAIGVSMAEELARLAIHGTLHVLGWDHPGGAGRARSRMWRLQEEILWAMNED